MIYFAAFVAIMFVIFYFKIIDLRIGFYKPEDRSKMNVVDNSYISTLKVFISEADYEHIIGKVIFFTTWNSFCRGSIEGISILNQLQIKYNDNKKIVFISYCSDLKPSSIEAFLKTRKLDLKFRFLNASEGLRSSLRTILSRDPTVVRIDPTIDSLNMSFIIDVDETVLYYKEGGMVKNEIPMIVSILDEI